jgi:hypothetical protein
LPSERGRRILFFQKFLIDFVRTSAVLTDRTCRRRRNDSLNEPQVIEITQNGLANNAG